MATKFCYGVKIDLSKTERFLSQHVLKSLKDSIKTLKSCDSLMLMAKMLKITQNVHLFCGF
uniref:Uncharacterized protein n=1 Tax=Cajanus cajan TaxID=3821 RepID=A0A151REQ6_CAJCA|nr:hypothetical protein KK1_037550 [Cajanus cajan]